MKREASEAEPENQIPNGTFGTRKKGGCSVSVTCPNGWELSCSYPIVGQCHSQDDGSIEGYVNCGVGAIQMGCWQYDMSWLESY
ncbi:MAG: hypothetical protein ABJR05_02985 [Balneola sp.]